MAEVMKSIGNPEITPRLNQTVADGVMQEAGNRSAEQLAKEEDEMLFGLLRLRVPRVQRA